MLIIALFKPRVKLEMGKQKFSLVDTFTFFSETRVSKYFPPIIYDSLTTNN